MRKDTTMKIELEDGRMLQGTPLQIVQSMQALSPGREGWPVAKYIEWMCEQITRTTGREVGGAIGGGSDAEQAKELVEALVAGGLAARV